MLIFVHGPRHDLEVPFFCYLIHEVLVNLEIAERCAVYVEAGCRGAGKVIVV
jgi:hypothetical protein